MRAKFVLFAIMLFLLSFTKGYSQNWVDLGTGYSTTDPYPFYYYKIATINGAADRYATILEVSSQGDANYYNQQGTYTVRIDKYEGTTTGRFDGVEVKCTSGNPYAATFYINNNEVWVRANYLWGRMYYRVVANFINTPVPATITPTTAAPSALYQTTNYGIKVDFDTNTSYPLPFTYVDGSTYFAQGLNLNSRLTNLQERPPLNGHAGEILGSSGSGFGADDGFLRLSAGGGSNVNTKCYIDISGYMANSSSDRYENITMGTQGLERMRIDANGNIGIGTTNAHGFKLAVNGAGIFTKVVVKSYAAWPDYVFDSAYHLPSLASVEKYVKENKHLEGVPDAASIEKDNIDLGAMQTTILKKLEEVTLYLIELKKENEALKEEVKQLKKK